MQIVCDWPVVIDAVEAELPWCTVDEWLTPCCDERFRFPVYAFARERHRSFPAARVLNDRILGRIRQGTRLSGLLVGVGSGPIPTHEGDKSVTARLVFHTIHGDRLLAHFDIELPEALQQPVPKKPATPRVPLFAPGDWPLTELAEERESKLS
jgi:hypothetical protein